MNKTFLLNCRFILEEHFKEHSAEEKQRLRLLHPPTPHPGASLPFALGILPEEKTALLASCLSLSHGTAASSYHKKPPGASRLLFSFPHPLIDLEYKAPILASAQFARNKETKKQVQHSSTRGSNKSHRRKAKTYKNERMSVSLNLRIVDNQILTPP